MADRQRKHSNQPGSTDASTDPGPMNPLKWCAQTKVSKKSQLSAQGGGNLQTLEIPALRPMGAIRASRGTWTSLERAKKNFR
eukprot:scaffold379_cov235-Pinguiococcus_pyrenoidosus.AAC.1